LANELPIKLLVMHSVKLSTMEVTMEDVRSPHYVLNNSRIRAYVRDPTLKADNYYFKAS